MEAEKEVKNQQTNIQIANLEYAANELKAQKEATAKKQEEAKQAHEQYLKEREKEHKERLKRLYEYSKEEIDIDAEIERQKAENKKTKFEEGYIITGEQQNAIVAQALGHLNVMKNDREVYNKEQLNATINLENAKFAVIEGALQLAMGLAGKNKAIADAIFIVDKGLAIARIIVDTQREIAGYAANPLWTALPDGGALIKGKYILGAKLRAGASIATIAATTIGKFTTGSTQGFGGGAGTLGLSAPLQPQGQQAQLTQLNQSSINALGNQAVRAYVVETDVTSSQQRIAAIQQRARFN